MPGITDRILWMATGLFCLLMLATIGVKSWQINSLKTQLSQQTLIAERYSHAIEISNQSIAQFKKDSDTATAQALSALKEAQKRTSASNRKLNGFQDKIDNAKTCDDSVTVAKELL